MAFSVVVRVFLLLKRNDYISGIDVWNLVCHGVVPELVAVDWSLWDFDFYFLFLEFYLVAPTLLAVQGGDFPLPTTVWTGALHLETAHSHLNCLDRHSLSFAGRTVLQLPIVTPLNFNSSTCPLALRTQHFSVVTHLLAKPFLNLFKTQTYVRKHVLTVMTILLTYINYIYKNSPFSYFSIPCIP